MYVQCVEMRTYSTYIHYRSLCLPSGTVIHSIGWGCHSPNPQKVSRFKGNFVFDLRAVLQERNLAWNEACLPVCLSVCLSVLFRATVWHRQSKLRTNIRTMEIRNFCDALFGNVRKRLLITSWLSVRPHGKSLLSLVGFSSYLVVSVSTESTELKLV